MRWHVSRLQPQAEWRVPKHLPGEEKAGGEEEQGQEGQGQEEEPEFKHHLGFRVRPNVPTAVVIWMLLHEIQCVLRPITDCCSTNRMVFGKGFGNSMPPGYAPEQN